VPVLLHVGLVVVHEHPGAQKDSGESPAPGQRLQTTSKCTWGDGGGGVGALRRQAHVHTHRALFKHVKATTFFIDATRCSLPRVSMTKNPPTPTRAFSGGFSFVPARPLSIPKHPFPQFLSFSTNPVVALFGATRADSTQHWRRPQTPNGGEKRARRNCF
jgi:hypothetical protein